MYNGIQFIEKDTKKIENLMTEHLLTGNMLWFEEGLIIPKIGGKSLYLPGKYIGIDANDKVSQAALASALREVVKTRNACTGISL